MVGGDLKLMQLVPLRHKVGLVLFCIALKINKGNHVTATAGISFFFYFSVSVT